MASPTLIGIAGPARSGKDTVANFIVAARGGYRYAFADPIREMVRVLGIDMSEPYWQKHKEDVIPALGQSPRRITQTLGTEWGRDLINPDIWLILAKQRLLRHGAGMVVSDVRFDNEAAWVRKQGGLMIHLHRPAAAAVAAHASESGVERVPSDAMLFNTGTLEELQTAVRGLLSVYDQT